jgi:hypothetical protein
MKRLLIALLIAILCTFTARVASARSHKNSEPWLLGLSDLIFSQRAYSGRNVDPGNPRAAPTVTVRELYIKNATAAFVSKTLANNLIWRANWSNPRPNVFVKVDSSGQRLARINADDLTLRRWIGHYRPPKGATVSVIRTDYFYGKRKQHARGARASKRYTASTTRQRSKRAQR